MQSVNVLQPTAPELYLMMQKINEISTNLSAEVSHYRAVGKKYKRAKKFVNWSAAGSSGLSFVFSSASFGSALSIDRFHVTSSLSKIQN